MAFSLFGGFFRGKGKKKIQPSPTQQTINVNPAPPVEEDVPMALELTHNEQFLVDGGVLTAGSTNVEEIGPYDIDTKTLRVVFKSGGVYEYYGVPLEVAVAFIESDSPGRFVWSKLRDIYAYAKVGETTKRPRPNVVRSINK